MDQVPTPLGYLF